MFKEHTVSIIHQLSSSNYIVHVVSRVFERYPESKALFSRVHVDDRDSPQWRAQLMRITNGWDMLVNMLEDPEVLYKEIEHLTDQHVAREGMKGKYMLVSIICLHTI